MDGTALTEQVRGATRTELERLGSDKALVAATEATLEPERVLALVAGSERAVRDLATTWAAAAESEAAREAFEAAATAATEQYEAALAELGREAVDPEAGVTVVDADREGDAERIGALLVGQSLALDRTLLQAVNFFVNEADERRADLVRGVRSAVDDRLDEGLVALDAVCAEADWDRAGDAASTVVRAAYADYVDALEALGVDPKPVC